MSTQHFPGGSVRLGLRRRAKIELPHAARALLAMPATLLVGFCFAPVMARKLASAGGTNSMVVVCVRLQAARATIPLSAQGACGPPVWG